MDEFNDLKFQEQRLIDNIQKLSKEDQKKIKTALTFAKKQHKGQQRDEGNSYIIHPIRVAYLLLKELNITDSDVISAALLHDVIEDTDTGLNEINNLFGEKTTRLVRNLTRIKQPDETLQNRYQRKFIKHQETMNKDKFTRAIKACDYLDNMMSWSGIPKSHPSRNKFKRWFKETDEMYIPLAQSVDRKLIDLMKAALAKAKNSSKNEMDN